MQFTLRQQIRRAQKNKYYSLLFVLLFVAGCSLFFYAWMYYFQETSYDSHLNNHDSIYRAVSVSNNNGKRYARSSKEIASLISQHIPEVEKLCCFRYISGVSLVTPNDDKFPLKHFVVADSAFFSVFQWGNRAIGKIPKGSLALAPKMLSKMPKKSAVTQATIQMRNGKEVTLQLAPPLPEQPAFNNTPFDAIGRMDDFYKSPTIAPEFGKAINNNEVYLYMKLRPGHDSQAVQNKINQTLIAQTGKDWKFTIELQNVQAIHTDSDVLWNPAPAVHENLLRASLMGGLLLLLLLATLYGLHTLSQILTRKQELMIRKVMGAQNGHLLKQLLTEIFTFFLLIGLLSVVTINFLPSGIIPGLSFAEILQNNTWLSMLLFASVLLFSSLFTALLSYSIIQKNVNLNLSAPRTSKGKKVNYLLAFQSFAFAIVLTLAFAFGKEIFYLKSTVHLGFQHENCLSIALPDKPTAQKYRVLKKALLSQAMIETVSATNTSIPGYNARMAGFKWHTDEKTGKKYGMMKTGSFTDDELESYETFTYMDVDADFLSAMGISLVQGKEFTLSDEEGILVNQTYVKQKRLHNPLDTLHPFLDSKTRILGVFGNFYNNKVKGKDFPHVLFLGKRANRFKQIIVRYRTTNRNELRQQIHDVWQKIVPDAPLEMAFLDEQVDQTFASEQRFASFLLAALLITVIITLFGLISFLLYATKQNMHMLAIHRIMGATTQELTVKELKRYLLLTSIALAAGFVVGYLIIEQIKQTQQIFTNSVQQNFVIPIMLSGIIMLIAGAFKWVTIRRLNPLEQLRE
jgi:putative ABC transport system permease protein